MKTVVIIGAGFSGTILTAFLLKRCTASTRIILINRSGSMARGLAYGTSSSFHLLNVPAGNMSAYADEPDHFLNYCKLHNPETTGASFVSRQLYGEYLSFVLDNAEQHAQPNVVFERLNAEVESIHQQKESITVKLTDGSILDADHTVLALGNFAPADPLRLNSILGKAHYVRDPWLPARKHPSLANESILLMGSGLTALDIAIKLVQQGHKGPIHMVSRRGLLPLPHRKTSRHPIADATFLNKLLNSKPSTSNYMRIIRSELETLKHTDLDWRDIIAAIRPLTAKLWQSLDNAERRRFLRHVQPYWDIHRHRVAPASFELFEQLCESGQIKIIAGRLKGISLFKNKLITAINLRSTQETLSIGVDRIINCTGPNTNIKHLNEHLITQLIKSKIVKPDDHNLGILVNNDLTVVNDLKTGAATLSYIGPMLKATYWEATAVPELRMYAEQLATQLTKHLNH